MAPGGGRFVWDAAGLDRDLATARADLSAGIIGAAREVLAATRGTRDFARRAQRSLVLGATAAKLNSAEVWAQEEPSCPDARLLYARVAAARALQAADARDRRAPDLLRMAVNACTVASELWSEDPTPWVVLLSLARLRNRATAPAPDGLGLSAPGPWDLLREIDLRDEDHREAGHRVLAYFYPRNGGSGHQARMVAEWLAQRCPEASPLRLLPLYAHFERGADGAVDAADQERRVSMLGRLLMDIGRGQPRYPEDIAAHRERLRSALELEQDPGYRDQLRLKALGRVAHGVYRQWFAEGCAPPYVPVTDLHVLAYGLLRSEQWELQAAKVFTHVLPYASTYPWSVFGAPDKELQRALDNLRLPRLFSG